MSTATQTSISAEEIMNGRDVQFDELAMTPPEYQELVIGMIYGHAVGEAFVLDNEVYAHWATDAPRTEDRFMVLHTIEEELLHAREAWRLLRQLGDLVDTKDLVPYRPKGSRYEGFRHATNTWGEFAAISALTDRVGCFQQEEQLDCSYIPYAESVQTVYFPLEKGHAARGRFWLRQLCETDEGRAEAQAAVNLWWPRALDMFGKSDGDRQHLYIKYRLKKRLNDERRQEYIKVVGAELAELGLTTPEPTIGRKFL